MISFIASDIITQVVRNSEGCDQSGDRVSKYDNSAIFVVWDFRDFIYHSKKYITLSSPRYGKYLTLSIYLFSLNFILNLICFQCNFLKWVHRMLIPICKLFLIAACNSWEGSSPSPQRTSSSYFYWKLKFIFCRYPVDNGHGYFIVNMMRLNAKSEKNIWYWPPPHSSLWTG